MNEPLNLPDPSPPGKEEPGSSLTKRDGGAARLPTSPDDETRTFHLNAGQVPAPGQRQRSEPRIPPDLLDHPRYCVLEYLGSGGMGTVYKARHRLMDRIVALKIISLDLADEPMMVDRFRREVRAAARLSHPNIVAAFDAEQAGDTHFLIMEFIDGIDLDRVLQLRGRLPIARACDYARQTSLGLQHAWECGMVHRDIKPHNLMLTSQGQVKILDFGLSRFLSEIASPEVSARKTAAKSGKDGGPANEDGTAPEGPPRLFKGTAYAYTGAGTADYIAPEEAIDARRADIRADIYSLGCTLYRFLAGRVPFPDGDLVYKVRCHMERTAERLAVLRPELPARLCQVVERMMAKEPQERFQTPAEVVQALAPFAVAHPRPILIVDDDPITRTLIADIFENHGYAVVYAGNGMEALDHLQRGLSPSLILLDLMMPVMDGWEFLKKQREDPALAAIPVIIVSAADTQQVRSIALGAADYLHKPIEPSELAAKVQSHVPPLS